MNTAMTSRDRWKRPSSWRVADGSPCFYWFAGWLILWNGMILNLVDTLLAPKRSAPTRTATPSS